MWDESVSLRCVNIRRTSDWPSSTSPGSWTAWAASSVACGGNCRRVLPHNTICCQSNGLLCMALCCAALLWSLPLSLPLSLSSDSGIRNITEDFVFRATDWSSACIQRPATQFPAQPAGDRLPAQRLWKVKESVGIMCGLLSSVN